MFSAKRALTAFIIAMGTTLSETSKTIEKLQFAIDSNFGKK